MVEKDNSTIEQNLSENYVPKSKMKDLPMSSQVDDAVREKMEKMKSDVEKFQKELCAKYSFVEAVGVAPAQAAKLIEEEFEVPEEDRKRQLLHLLVIIPEKKYKDLGKVKLEAIKLAKKINDKLWVHVMDTFMFWELGLDSKFDIMEAFAMSMPILDKGILGGVRAASIHKSLVLRTFEKYVTSYVIGGSLVRGDAKSTSDVDVFVVIDDTDVKRMPRLELLERLRAKIYQMIPEAEAMAGVKNKLNIQIYLLTNFWDSVKDAHPVMFTFIRDGIPLYDRGTFLPWKLLLKMGKIKPSPEAIDMFMSSGDKMDEIVKRRIFDVMIDIFWSILTPTQGLLMLYGQSPGSPKATVESFEETFVKKEHLVEQKYADILREIVIDYFKAYEHNKIKPGDISGADIDRLFKNSADYIKRLKDLREQIDARVREKNISEIYDDVFNMLKGLTGKESEAEMISTFDKNFVKQGKFPQGYLDSIKFISKTKEEVLKKVSRDLSKKKMDELENKRRIDTEKARKLASEIVEKLIENAQRCEFVSMEKSRFIAKGREWGAEIFFLENVFIVKQNSIQILKGTKLVNSTVDELRKQLAEQQNKPVKIDFKSLDVLRKVLGEFELLQ